MPAVPPKIDILLATYNGAHYVEAQIDSILEQSYPNIHLWIRDDLSKDNTLIILNRKAAQFPSKITIVPAEKNLGVAANFGALMAVSTAPYAMFCDQDDIWLPHKVEITLKKMLETEAVHKENTPILIHTDLKVVGANLNEINPSFWNHSQVLPAKSHSLNRLLMQNVITGCTMMINRALASISSPLPKNVIMHDWWIGLVAAALGKIEIVNESSMLYRQHANNQIGAKPKKTTLQLIRDAFSKPSEHFDWITQLLEKQQAQARLLLDRYDVQLTSKQKKTLEAFCKMNYEAYCRRIYLTFKFHFFKNGYARNLRMFLLFPPFFKTLDYLRRQV